MSTSRFLWAVAFTSISLVATARVDAVKTARVRALETEVTLAEAPDLYMIVDVENRVLRLKARGIVLEEIPLTGIGALERSTISRLGSVEPLEVPVVWHVFSKPGGGSRPVLTPTLDGATSQKSEAPPVVRPQLNVVAPTSYEFPVEEGWTIEIGQFEDAPGFLARVGAAVQSGFERLVLRSPRTQGRSLRLGMASADAERLHHLFRKGMAVLIVKGSGDTATDN